VAKDKAVGLKVADQADAAKWADLAVRLTPDEGQGDLYRDKLDPYMKPGAASAFAHGLNIHFNLRDSCADIAVFMIAPIADFGERVTGLCITSGTTTRETKRVLDDIRFRHSP
jgi:ketol-acid reductoisomerase